MDERTSFVFLCATSPWVGAIAESVAQMCPTAVVDVYDWLTHRRARARKWPFLVPSAVAQETWAYPPTYLSYLRGPFALLGRYRLKRFIESQARSRRLRDPWIVCPYPWYNSWVPTVLADKILYYNFDDYLYYYPASRWATIERQEAKIVARAKRTLCVSRYQVDKLKEKYPQYSARITHLPLGVPDDFLNKATASVPSTCTVGYVGTLEDRIDWKFVQQVACALPAVEFVFVGPMTNGTRGPTGWTEARARAFELPNVRHVSEVKQSEVCEWYRGFQVNWIPYDTGHPFNRASCPTKIMDGLASGRPLISTAIPECCLYPDWITIVNTQEEACARISEAVRDGSDPVRAAEQVAFAAKNTWSARAAEFVRALDGNERAEFAAL